MLNKTILMLNSSIKIPTQIKTPNHIKNSVRLPMHITGEESKVKTLQEKIKNKKLHTVCEEALCPNLGHCWNQGTATFLIMGDICTRRCHFCNIKTARPQILDSNEAENLAQTVKDMNLRHVVITSVDRDDLKDCGSEHFAKCILAVRESNPKIRIEVLIPDFKARGENLQKIWMAKPDIINHNVETVPSLYRKICPQSNYENSLKVLELSFQEGFVTKSGIILGLGEEITEVSSVIDDLANLQVSILTIGQYLPPSSSHAKLMKLIPEETFAELKHYATKKGIKYTQAGHFVRSSYHAQESFEIFWKKQQGDS